MIVWLIGMSGAGKTTIGRELCKKWKVIAPNTVLIDGDEIRTLYNHDSLPNAHSIDGRRVNAERITELCAWLDRQNVNVVCCILSIFPDLRAANRERFSDYKEVFIRVPMDVLEKRDSKGLYAGARAGKIENVVGIDIAFPEPKNADLVIDNHGATANPQGLASDILYFLNVSH